MACWTWHAGSWSDSPFFMDNALAKRLHSFDADGPIPPVLSRPKGQHNQLASRHGAEFAFFFADSASEAVAVATPRVACGPERRNGWTMVTSTAKGLESEELSNTSAGRDAVEVAGSSKGRHPASWDSRKRVSRTRLWRRYIPAEAQEREWSPKKSIGDPHALHTGEGPWDRGTPVR